jgi:hypothetical protein
VASPLFRLSTVEVGDYGYLRHSCIYKKLRQLHGISSRHEGNTKFLKSTNSRTELELSRRANQEGSFVVVAIAT